MDLFSSDDGDGLDDAALNGEPLQLLCGGQVLGLDRVAIMGVLNVTPDSFSDGGLWLDPEVAVKHALEMHEEGADIIDVGGESTRPGAADVPEDEELRRILPVIAGIRSASDVLISVDTRKSLVARRAVEAGAHILNDTMGEATDGSMDDVALETGAGIILMHSRGTPATMREMVSYEDVVWDVRAFLEKRALELEVKGMARDAIAVDPGFGFAKKPDQNLTLLKGLRSITDLEWPVLVGTSRKSFIGAVLDLPEEERLEGTLATVVTSVLGGARMVRVHDVKSAVRAVRMTEAIAAAG